MVGWPRCGEAGDCPQQSAMGTLVAESGWMRELKCGKGDLRREVVVGNYLVLLRVFGGVLRVEVRRKSES